MTSLKRSKMADRRRRRHSEEDSGDEFSDSPAKPDNAARFSECESETEHQGGDLSEYESTADESRFVEETEEETDSDVDTDEGTAEQESGGEGSVVDEERQSGDGQEQPKENLDDDEDKANPAYIPRKGAFFEHDVRLDMEGNSGDPLRDDKRGKGKLWKDETRWIHDKFDFSDQAPKSRDELVALYGYDITVDDQPPEHNPKNFNRPRGRGRKTFQDYLPEDVGRGRRRSYGSNRDQQNESNHDNQYKDDYPSIQDSNSSQGSPTDPGQDRMYQGPGDRRGDRGRGYSRGRGGGQRPRGGYSNLRDEQDGSRGHENTERDNRGGNRGFNRDDDRERNNRNYGDNVNANRDNFDRDRGRHRGGFGNRGGGRNDYGNRENRNDYGNRDNRNEFGNRENRNEFGNRGGRNDYGNRGGRNDYGNRGGRDDFGNRGNRNSYDNRDFDNNRNSGFGDRGPDRTRDNYREENKVNYGGGDRNRDNYGNPERDTQNRGDADRNREFSDRVENDGTSGRRGKGRGTRNNEGSRGYESRVGGQDGRYDNRNTNYGRQDSYGNKDNYESPRGGRGERDNRNDYRSNRDDHRDKPVRDDHQNYRNKSYDHERGTGGDRYNKPNDNRDAGNSSREGDTHMETNVRQKAEVAERKFAKSYEKPTPKSYYTLSPLDDEKLVGEGGDAEEGQEYGQKESMRDFNVTVSGSGRRSYMKDRPARASGARSQDNQGPADDRKESVPVSKHQPSLPPRLQQQQKELQERKKMQQQQQQQQQQQASLEKQDSGQGRSNKRYSSQRQRPVQDIPEPQSSQQLSGSPSQQTYTPISEFGKANVVSAPPPAAMVIHASMNPPAAQRPATQAPIPNPPFLLPHGPPPPPHGLVPAAGPRPQGPPPGPRPLTTPPGARPLTAGVPPPPIFPPGTLTTSALPVSMIGSPQLMAPAMVYAAPPPPPQVYPMPIQQQFPAQVPVSQPALSSIPPVLGNIPPPIAPIPAMPPVQSQAGDTGRETVRGGTTYYAQGSTHPPSAKSTGMTFYPPEMQKQSRVQIRRPKTAIPIVNPQDIKKDGEEGMTYTEEGEGDERLNSEYDQTGEDLEPTEQEYDTAGDEPNTNTVSDHPSEGDERLSSNQEQDTLLEADSSERLQANENTDIVQSDVNDTLRSSTSERRSEDLSDCAMNESSAISDSGFESSVVEQTEDQNSSKLENDTAETETVNSEVSSSVSKPSTTSANVVFKAEVLSPTLSVSTVVQSVESKGKTVTASTDVETVETTVTASTVDQPLESKVDQSVDSVESKVDQSVDSVESKLTAVDDVVESKITAAENLVESKLTAVEDVVESKLTAVEDVVEAKITAAGDATDHANVTDEGDDELADSFEDAVEEVASTTVEA